MQAKLTILLFLPPPYYVYRIVSRDIGGSDPERMAAPKVEEYLQEVFTGSGLEVTRQTPMRLIMILIYFSAVSSKMSDIFKLYCKVIPCIVI